MGIYFAEQLKKISLDDGRRIATYGGSVVAGLSSSVDGNLEGWCSELTIESCPTPNPECRLLITPGGLQSDQRYLVLKRAYYGGLKCDQLFEPSGLSGQRGVIARGIVRSGSSESSCEGCFIVILEMQERDVVCVRKALGGYDLYVATIDGIVKVCGENEFILRNNACNSADVSHELYKDYLAKDFGLCRWSEVDLSPKRMLP